MSSSWHLAHRILNLSGCWLRETPPKELCFLNVRRVVASVFFSFGNAGLILHRAFLSAYSQFFLSFVLSFRMVQYSFWETFCIPVFLMTFWVTPWMRLWMVVVDDFQLVLQSLDRNGDWFQDVGSVDNLVGDTSLQKYSSKLVLEVELFVFIDVATLRDSVKMMNLFWAVVCFVTSLFSSFTSFASTFVSTDEIKLFPSFTTFISTDEIKTFNCFVIWAVTALLVSTWE